MKRLVVLSSAVLLIATVSLAAQIAYAGDFSVQRFVVCSDVQDREPVGISDSFVATDERVYAFLEARDITAPTTVNVVWYYEGAEQRRTPLNLGRSSRWRTYSYKNLYGMTGNWRVDLVDASGNVVSSAKFTVK